MTISKAIIESVVKSGKKSRRIVRSDRVEWHDDDGNLHREDGPAREWKSGTTEWWTNGKPHRLDGPAREWAIQSKTRLPKKEWLINGKLHRLDGPAQELMDGSVRWWVNGRQFTEDEFYRYVDQETGEVLAPPGKKLTYDKNDAIIDSVLESGTKSRRSVVRGLYTRWVNAAKKLHRISGPAVEWTDGRKEWWVNGRRFTEQDFYLYVDQATGDVLVPPGKRLKYDEDDEDIENDDN